MLETSLMVRFQSDYVTEDGSILLGRLAESLTVTPSDFASATGQATESVAKNFGETPVRLRNPEAVRVAGELVEVAGLLRLLGMDEERIRKWMRTQNPSLGGRSPLAVIKDKGGRSLIDTLMSVAMGGSGVGSSS